MKKILITGAAGFVGSHLVEHLLEDGVPLEKLRLFIPPWQDLSNLPKKNFDIFLGDVRNIDDVEQAIKDVETVYHLAAKTVFEGKTYEDFKDTNVDGTKNLLEACKGKKIQKFVLFSSIAVFGLPAYRGDVINCNETWTKKPLEVYGQSKLDAENAVLEAHKKWGIPYTIVRPTTVYGPRDKGNLTELISAIKKHTFFFIGNGKNLMDYVYVVDLVKGARLAQLNKKITSDYILGGGKPIQFREVVKIVAKAIGENIPRFYIPRLIGLILSYPVSMMFTLLGKRPVLFPDRVKVMTASCYFDISKAKKEIKFLPSTDFSIGVAETVSWLNKNKSN